MAVSFLMLPVCQDPLTLLVKRRAADAWASSGKRSSVVESVLGTRNGAAVLLKHWHFDPHEARDSHGHWTRVADGLRDLSKTMADETARSRSAGHANSRYMTAGRDLKKAAAAMNAGDHDLASTHLDAAITHMDRAGDKSDIGEAVKNEARGVQQHLAGTGDVSIPFDRGPEARDTHESLTGQREVTGDYPELPRIAAPEATVALTPAQRKDYDLYRQGGIDHETALRHATSTPEQARAYEVEQNKLRRQREFDNLGPAGKREYKRWAPAVGQGNHQGAMDAGIKADKAAAQRQAEQAAQPASSSLRDELVKTPSDRDLTGMSAKQLDDMARLRQASAKAGGLQDDPDVQRAINAITAARDQKLGTVKLPPTAPTHVASVDDYGNGAWQRSGNTSDGRNVYVSKEPSASGYHDVHVAGTGKIGVVRKNTQGSVVRARSGNTMAGRTAASGWTSRHGNDGVGLPVNRENKNKTEAVASVVAHHQRMSTHRAGTQAVSPVVRGEKTADDSDGERVDAPKVVPVPKATGSAAHPRPRVSKITPERYTELRSLQSAIHEMPGTAGQWTPQEVVQHPSNNVNAQLSAGKKEITARVPQGDNLKMTPGTARHLLTTQLPPRPPHWGTIANAPEGDPAPGHGKLLPASGIPRDDQFTIPRNEMPSGLTRDQSAVYMSQRKLGVSHDAALNTARQTPAADTASAGKQVHVSGLPAGYTLHDTGKRETGHEVKAPLKTYELRKNGQPVATIQDVVTSAPKGGKTHGRVAVHGFTYTKRSSWSITDPDVRQNVAQLPKSDYSWEQRQRMTDSSISAAPRTVSEAAKEAAESHEFGGLSPAGMSAYRSARYRGMSSKDHAAGMVASRAINTDTPEQVAGSHVVKPSTPAWRVSHEEEEYSGVATGATQDVHQTTHNGHDIFVDEPHNGAGWRYQINDHATGNALAYSADSPRSHLNDAYSSAEDAKTAAIARSNQLAASSPSRIGGWDNSDELPAF